MEVNVLNIIKKKCKSYKYCKWVGKKCIKKKSSSANIPKDGDMLSDYDKELLKDKFKKLDIIVPINTENPDKLKTYIKDNINKYRNIRV